ncbi:MAG TPA: thymidine kinase [Candidatus Limnocylindrales bacterium]|nr:thymidine kinase [Candidatus Limnocylindrales bacterium]
MDRFFADRERRRLGSLTVYSGPTHSGKTKKLDAEVERAQRQGRAVQRVDAPMEAATLLAMIEPETELLVIDRAEAFLPDLVGATDTLAGSRHRIDVVVAGWELDYRGQPHGPLPQLLCTADFAIKLDDGVCASPGCRNPASRTQRFVLEDGAERFAPVCRRHHDPQGRTKAFQEGWFEEPTGSLEVVAGCMFSGKTQELIRRLDQERYAGAGIQVFKPALDDRYAIEAVASHRDLRFPALAVPDVDALVDQLRDDTRVVGIDEAQFFDDRIVSLCEQLAGRGLHTIVAGLELDFLGRPFGPMPWLMAHADRLTKLQASCQFPGCGSRQATRTQRLEDGQPASSDSPLVVIGGAARYQARCRHHHEIPALDGSYARHAAASGSAARSPEM